jgi:hypothetical protein
LKSCSNSLELTIVSSLFSSFGACIFKKWYDTIDLSEPHMISGFLSPQHGMSSDCKWRNGLQYGRVAVYIFHEQSQTANKGWGESSSKGVLGETNKSSP